MSTDLTQGARSLGARLRGWKLAIGAGIAALALTGASWGLHDTVTAATTEPTGEVQTAPPAMVSGPAQTSYADLVANVTPAVVTVRSERLVRQTQQEFQIPDDPFFRRFFGDPSERAPRRPFRQGGLGSGVIVTQDGYILTNAHVVNGAQRVQVELTDRRTFDAKVVGSDEASDLAVLKIEAKNLPTLPIGNSDSVRVGDVVLAVGNPLGVGQTVTMGIISAKGRATGLGDGSYEDFLQTDAPINQGNSGGALVSMKGELVGINSQILSPSGGNIGIGFAIPSHMAQQVMDQLMDHGKVRRGQLGVTIQPVTSDLARSMGMSDVRGAIVSDVTANSAADHAGVKRGDVIVALNGTSVNDGNALRNAIAGSAPGTEVDLTVMRDGREQRLKARLDEFQPKAQGADADDQSPSGQSGDARFGMNLQPLTPQLARQLEIEGSTRGLLVRSVDPAGRAAAAGIQEGDVIQEVNRKPVESVDALRSAVNEAKDKPALVLVYREGRSIFLTFDPAQ